MLKNLFVTLVCLGLALATPEDENGVWKLNDSNFNDTMKAEDKIFLFVYDPKV